MRLVLTGFLLLLLVSVPHYVGAQMAGSKSTRAWKTLTVVQAIFSRSPLIDHQYRILKVDDVLQMNVSHLWFNVEYDGFFTEHKLNMTAYILSESKKMTIDYISSPEVGFLRSIAPSFKGSKTKLILSFPDSASNDSSTKLAYSSYLKNLTFVKTFASGILVPKSYIWATGADRYLLPHTSLVSDAHAAGLIVFASGFANDNALSYNYTYDPMVEYLSYVNTTDFSLDGVLSDFPVTAAVAIDCFSEVSNRTTSVEKPLVMSFLGSSGIYAGCTDLAYQQAVCDGADILDCPVQMTKDGVPICLNTTDLLSSTTVSRSKFFFSCQNHSRGSATRWNLYLRPHMGGNSNIETGNTKSIW